MKTEYFDYETATFMPLDPLELRGKKRDQGRMVVLDRESNSIAHKNFPDLLDYLKAGDLLVFNDSYILSNTLSFVKDAQEGQIIVYGQEPDGSCLVKIRPTELAHKGLSLQVTHNQALTCTLVESQPDDIWKVQFSPQELLQPALEDSTLRLDDSMHLDPDHWKQEKLSYRSVYSKKPGSLEIPSAGLHFSQEILDNAAKKGVEFAFLTLHVGSTEVPAERSITKEHVEEHELSEEYYEVPEETAAKVNKALQENRRVIAVGTTVIRTLEAIAKRENDTVTIAAGAGWTGLYIYPGFELQVVGALLTNLHQPRSSHIVLASAVAGPEFAMKAYDEVLADGGYEFDMFGDSMFII